MRDTRRDADERCDVAVVGAGGAGLSLLLALDRALDRAQSLARTHPPRVVLLDSAAHFGPERTWCFWDGGSGPLDDLIHRSWSILEVIDPSGHPRRLDLSPMRYLMLRSPDLVTAAEEALRRLAASRLIASVDTVEDGPGEAVVVAGDRRIRARWVFDSRPAPPARPGSTTLLQHFRGWTVRLPDDLLDPATATLMDFSVAQPPRGVAFVYCLPLDGRRALVEYTVFSRRPLASAEYNEALRRYLGRRWGVGANATVEAVEEGIIPMTDAVFPRRVGRRVFRLGTAGGATRPASGYTFAAMQRQADAVAAALLSGRDPQPPAAYPARHRWMDAVLLRAIDRGHVRGAWLLAGLLANNPPQRVLRFLDGMTSLGEDVALMRTTPSVPMATAVLGDAVARARRRLSR